MNKRCNVAYYGRIRQRGPRLRIGNAHACKAHEAGKELSVYYKSKTTELPGFSESMVAHERQMISRGVLRLQKKENEASHGGRCAAPVV